MPLNVPENQAVLDWLPDGERFLMMAYEMRKSHLSLQLRLRNRDGEEVTALTDGTHPVRGGRFSPDGRKVLCALSDPQPYGKIAPDFGLFVFDLKNKRGTGFLPELVIMLAKALTDFTLDHCGTWAVGR